MSTLRYTPILQQILQGNIDLDSGVQCYLCDSSYSPSISHATTSSVPSGSIIATTTISTTPFDDRIIASDSIFSSLTGSTGTQLVIFDGTTGYLLGQIGGLNIVPDGNDYRVDWANAYRWSGTAKVYEPAMEDFFRGNIDLVNDTILVDLVDSAYTYSQSHSLLSDIPSASLLGDPKTLSSKTVSSTGTFNANDVEFTLDGSGSNFNRAIVYKSSTNRLICLNENFSITADSTTALLIWSGSGIFRA